MPTLIANARATGRSLHIGDGAGCWPAGHLDAAHLYRLALETAPAGSRLHGAAERGIAFRDIAQVIGDAASECPTLSVTPEQALDEIGFVGAIAALDNPTSSEITRTLLGWRPRHPGLLDDLRAGRYFDAG